MPPDTPTCPQAPRMGWGWGPDPWLCPVQKAARVALSAIHCLTQPGSSRRPPPAQPGMAPRLPLPWKPPDRQEHLTRLYLPQRCMAS